jgi:hypothetical protein
MPPTSNLSRRLSPNAHFKFSLQVMYLTLDPLQACTAQEDELDRGFAEA